MLLSEVWFSCYLKAGCILSYVQYKIQELHNYPFNYSYVIKIRNILGDQQNREEHFPSNFIIEVSYFVLTGLLFSYLFIKISESYVGETQNKITCRDMTKPDVAGLGGTRTEVGW